MIGTNMHVIDALMSGASIQCTFVPHQKLILVTQHFERCNMMEIHSNNLQCDVQI